MQARLRQRLQLVSIGVRLTVMMAVLLAAAMGTFGAITLSLQREAALDAVKWEAQRLIESLDNTLQVQMLRGDTHLSEAVTRIARARSVESATLTKHRGLVRYSTDSRAVGRRVPLTSPQCSGCHRGGQGGKPVVSRAPRVWIQREQSRISVTMPILNHSTCYDNACHAHAASEPVLGVLELDLPFGPVSRALEHYRQRVLLLIAVLVPLTSLLVLLLTRRWVGRPVARLVRATRAVARGDLTQALEQGEGELGELAQAFNRMEQSLQTSQRQIVASEKLASV
ncbi:MAG: HAMP domain-containing protein, partial [Myxococcales bacterium]